MLGWEKKQMKWVERADEMGGESQYKEEEETETLSLVSWRRRGYSEV